VFVWSYSTMVRGLSGALLFLFLIVDVAGLRQARRDGRILFLFRCTSAELIRISSRVYDGAVPSPHPAKAPLGLLRSGRRSCGAATNPQSKTDCSSMSTQPDANPSLARICSCIYCWQLISLGHLYPISCG